jgi:HSP20 family molecular chaperone IbpA
MIEQFMEAFGDMPEGSFSIRSWNGSTVTRPLETEIEPMTNEPEVEKIDLGDSVLLLIQEEFEIEPKVRVEGSIITVQTGTEREDITLEIEFPIDLEKSNVSYRNGVLEITAVRAETESEREGYLKIE